MAALTVTAPGWNRYRGQMSGFPRARSIRVAAVASTVRGLMKGAPPPLLPLAPMNPPMDCPRCGQKAVTEAACPRCGVIVAKARTPRTPPGERPPAAISSEATSPPRGGIGGLGLGLMAALLVLAGAIGSRLWERSHLPALRATEPAASLPVAASGPLDA